MSDYVSVSTPLDTSEDGSIVTRAQWYKEVFTECGELGLVENIMKEMENGGRVLKNPHKSGLLQSLTFYLISNPVGMERASDRLNLVANGFPCEEFLRSLNIMDAALDKTDEFTAVLFVERAKEFFKETKFDKALRSLNLALAFSPEDCDLFGTVYCKRARYFYVSSNWKASASNAERALKHNVSAEIERDMRLMRDRSLQLATKAEDRKIKDYEKHCFEVLFKVHGESNPLIPSAGTCISIQKDNIKGRKIVATQDIRPGTTIMCEDPYVTLQTEEVRWDFHYCSHCLHSCECWIPCPNCVFVMYCSENCLKKAYDDGHKYICPCMNYIHATETPTSLLLALKAVCKAGPQEMFNIYQQRASNPQEEGDTSEEIRGFDQTGVYASNSIYQVLNLVEHPDEVRACQNIKTFYCYALVKALEFKTEFFDDIDILVREPFRNFVASMFRRQMDSMTFNCMSLWDESISQFEKVLGGSEADRMDPRNIIAAKAIVENKENDEAGLVGIFSLGSLICHSCDPNCHRINLQSGKLAIITNRRIKNGEEITISYGFEYETHTLEQRIKQAKKYKFTCTCPPCAHEWPVQGDLEEKVSFYCPKCKDGNESEPKASIIIIDELGTTGKCPTCESTFDALKITEKFDYYVKKYLEADAFVKDFNVMPALQPLLECIEFFQSHIPNPNRHFLNATNLLLIAHESISCHF